MQQVDLARFRGPAFSATRTINVAVTHIGDRDLLSVTTDVFVPAIAGMLSYSLSDHLPVLRLRPGRVLGQKTYAAAQPGPASSGCFDPSMLTTIKVTIVEFVKTVVTIALRIGPAKHGADPRGGRLTPRADAMGAFRIVAKDKADPLESRGATSLAAEHDMQAIYGATDEFEALGLRGFMPMRVCPTDRD